jgi:hypothetical protein
MLRRLALLALNWLVSHATMKIETSPEPFGRRVGGTDIPGVTDKYLVLHFIMDGTSIWSCCWQLS